MKMFRALIAALTVAAGLAGPAQADRSFLTHFMGGQGCAVGPEAAMAAHLPSDRMYPALLDFAEAALAEGNAERQGDWIVLGPEICTIRLPKIEAAFDLDDPVVERAFGPIDEFAEYEDYGCYLNVDALFDGLRSDYGLGDDRLMQVYADLVAKGVVEGTITFYSDDVLVTPPGFQRISGACADLDGIADIRRSQALLRENFDQIVRANAAAVTCAPSSSAVDMVVGRTVTELAEGQPANVWGLMEVLMLGISAGWVEGASLTERGTPRPPICSYDN